ncbi:LOW QUALITY PROTEIN: hypothetical protein Cgig2_026252 [Carnegiea gigantea]|uniref:Uncharacterized protein n=1 Tax=Carnegiea gigantea TaxID=171969 RepID=A0A9Q1KH69_9CARY|nr:LOW QUALITY PROTEIN: hypothetical protein Cgig2_026252 [Carnegiea gigantea]
MKSRVITRNQPMKNAKVLCMLLKSGYLFTRRSCKQNKDYNLPTWKNVRNSTYKSYAHQSLVFVNNLSRRVKKMYKSIRILFALNKDSNELKPIRVCSQIMHENKLISNNWLEFLDCMRIAGRDWKKLTLIGKRIQNVVKELKELDGGISESKISELKLFIGSSVPERIDILPLKHCHTKGSGKFLKGGKEKSMEQQQKR